MHNSAGSPNPGKACQNKIKIKIKKRKTRKALVYRTLLWFFIQVTIYLVNLHVHGDGSLPLWLMCPMKKDI